MEPSDEEILRSQFREILGRDPTPEEIAQNDKAFKALNKLGKWRTVLTGEILGTRSKTDPEAKGIRSLMELRLLIRVELTALVVCLVRKGSLDFTDFQNQLVIEAEHLEKVLERAYPGFSAMENGMKMDPRASETTKGWKP